jgi:hypothetical protein
MYDSKTTIPSRLMQVLLCLWCIQLSAQPVALDLRFNDVELNDGSSMEAVTVQSFNRTTGRVTLLADRQLRSLDIADLPDAISKAIQEQLATLEESGNSKGIITHNSSGTPRSNASTPAAGHNNPNERNHAILLRRFQQTSLAIIREHALRYYEYEHTVDGRQVHVLSDTLQIEPRPIQQNPPSKAVELHVTGKVTIQPVGGDPANPELLTASFAAATQADYNKSPALLHLRHLGEE